MQEGEKLFENVDGFDQFDKIIIISSISSEFNLTAALFGETDAHSLAGVVVRKSTYENLTSTAGVTACVNEYNGIGNAFRLDTMPANIVTRHTHF